MERQHFSNTASSGLTRETGARARSAVGWSLLVHALVLATMVAAVGPTETATSPVVTPIEMVFDTAAPAPADIPLQTESSPDQPEAVPTIEAAETPPPPLLAPTPQPDRVLQSAAPSVPQRHTRVLLPVSPSAATRKPPLQRQPPRTAPSTQEPAQPPTESFGHSPQIAPATPAPALPAPADISAGWRSALAAWLQSHRTYPDEARRRVEEGTAVVRFSVARDGRVIDVTLVRSSGSSALDDAAQAMFRDARMPAFTADMAQAQTTVTVPIRYRLEH